MRNTVSVRQTASARRGVAIIVTLVFLAVFACLAVGIATSAGMNMTAARNRVNATQAQALAEAGLQLLQRQLGNLAVPGTHDAVDLHEAIAEHLQNTWASTGMLDPDEIAWDTSGVTIPVLLITRDDGRTGQITLHAVASGGALDNTTVTLQSTGEFDGARKTVYYNMTVQRGASVLLNYGIASKSPVVMTGNARVQGANRPAEGNVLSATYSTEQAVRMTGNITVTGDVDVVNPDGQISRTGNCTIGGSMHIGVQEPDWPTVDISQFTQYATNVRSTGGSGNLTLSNIRIPPNSNPTFSGNVTIYGVVYVQAPNKVTFSGNANLIGCIVCDTPAVDNLNANQIKFTGNLTTSGVENLPAGSQYDGLRDLTGSFLLAPGFSAQFSGNFNTVNGCMVASEFKFTGNAAGRVKGGVVNLRDSTFQMTGNACLTIDRDNAVQNPAGLSSSYRLVCVSGSYSE